MKQIKLLCLGTLLGILTAVKAAPIQYFFENDLRTMPNYHFRVGDIIAIQIAEGKKLILQIDKQGQLTLPKIPSVTPNSQTTTPSADTPVPSETIFTLHLTVSQLTQRLKHLWQLSESSQIWISIHRFEDNDMLEIQVVGHPELTSRGTIRNGLLMHAYLGPLELLGLTKGSLEQLIAEQLQAHAWAENPQVQIEFLGQRNSLMSVPPADKKVGIPMGPFIAYPQFTFAWKQDSNIRYEPSEGESSLIFSTLPKLVLERKQSGNTYLLGASADTAVYFSGANDNYADFTLFGTADWRLHRFLKFKLQADYSGGHDARGTTDWPDREEPNRWHTLSSGGTLLYGRREAQGQLELTFQHQKKRYDQFGHTELLGDKNNSLITGTFFHQIWPKTYLLTELAYLNTDYLSFSSPGNSNQKSYGLGIQWETMTHINAQLKIGYQKRDYEASDKRDFTGKYWENELYWYIRDHSRLKAVAHRLVEDATGFGDYQITHTIGLQWRHSWTRWPITSTLDFSTTNRDYANTMRSDDLQDYLIGLDYPLRNWLKVGTALQFTRRESTLQNYDFHKTVLMINLQGQF